MLLRTPQRDDRSWRDELAIRLGTADLPGMIEMEAWDDEPCLDFMVIDGMQFTVCTEAFKHAVDGAALTGIQFVPVRVQNSAAELPPLYAMQILGRCGVLHLLDPQAKRGLGRGLMASEYDGTDFATRADRKGATPLLISERAERVLRSFTGMEFVPVKLVDSLP